MRGNLGEKSPKIDPTGKLSFGREAFVNPDICGVKSAGYIVRVI